MRALQVHHFGESGMLLLKERLKLKPALAALFICLPLAFSVYGQGQRTASGIIYFTNNSPDSLADFRVEVLTPNRKKIIAATPPDDHDRFEFRSLKPGKYLLRVTWANHCVLSYRMDLTKESRTKIRVLMDLECAHFNGQIRDLPAD
jgi:hypothetical protein